MDNSQSLIFRTNNYQPGEQQSSHPKCTHWRGVQNRSAMATISSGEHVVQGGPALIQINSLGQTNMVIFHCTNHTMTINKHTILGIVEKLTNEDQVGELIWLLTWNRRRWNPLLRSQKKKENISWTKSNLLETKIWPNLSRRNMLFFYSNIMKPSATASSKQVESWTQLMTFNSRNRIRSTWNSSGFQKLKEKPYRTRGGSVETCSSLTLQKQVSNPIYIVSKPDGGLRNTWLPGNQSRDPARTLFNEESTVQHWRSKLSLI